MLNLAIYINMYNAKYVRNRAKWFRSIKPGEISEGHFRDSLKFKSISVQLREFNRTYGIKKGVFVHAKYLPDDSMIILVGVTLEEREKELSDRNFSGLWREFLNKYER